VFALVLCLSASLSACGGGGTSQAQVPLGAHQTIVFAVDGGISASLGSEGRATGMEIAAFEKAHPNITVKVLPLSETADTAYQQVTQRFIAGSSTPDVIDTDSSWPAGFARAGWIMPLDKFGINKGAFLPGAVAATTYLGKLYAAYWYYNVEGLYYRTDLAPQPPTTPQALVTDAKAALKKDHSLREGLAFEGSKYEGLVTVFIDFLGAFGGKLDPAHLNTPANLKALQFLHNVVDSYHIAPQAVTSWTEQNVQDAYVSGQSAFATNWPYLLGLAEAKGSQVAGKTGFVPFPSQSGKGVATLASDVLTVNAKSTHVAADEALVKWLLTPSQQIMRAIESGDPPSVQAAYTPALFARAPYFRVDEQVFRAAVPRLVSPNYHQISQAIQAMLSSVLANQQTPAQALKATAQQIAPLAHG
jgi:multiple sugar transport system substrate-binding protein